jgi:two-component system, NarL family, response regulator LiaR
MSKKIRVLIADDHPPVRDGLADLLSKEPDIEVVAKAADGEETVNLVKKLAPDVAIIDVAMPKLDGIKATEKIKASSKGTMVLMLSAYPYEAYLLAALRAGASGYMLKTSLMDELISAIRSLSKGQSVFDEKAISILVHRLNTSTTKREIGCHVLHPRQIEVLRLVAKGNSNKQIAQKLEISERTVQTHLIRVFKELGTDSRLGAVLNALREGFLNLEDLLDGR